MRFICASAAAALLIAFSGSAYATTGWTGDTIRALDVYDGYLELPYTVTLSDGSTVSAMAWQDYGTFTVPGSANGNLQLSFNLYDNQITILAAPGDPSTITTTWLPVHQNGYDFFDISNNPGITGITLDSSSTANGASNADVSFTSDTVKFDFAGQQWYGGTEAVYDVTFGGTAVPEPATWALFIAGLFGTGFMMRGARQKGAVTLS